MSYRGLEGLKEPPVFISRRVFPFQPSFLLCVFFRNETQAFCFLFSSSPFRSCRIVEKERNTPLDLIGFFRRGKRWKNLLFRSCRTGEKGEEETSPPPHHAPPPSIRMSGGDLRARFVYYGRKPFVLTQGEYIYFIIVHISEFYLRVSYFYEYLAYLFIHLCVKGKYVFPYLRECECYLGCC